jgi:cell cycle arrest protein BUB3
MHHPPLQTRCVRCLPDGRGYAVASVEGRVAVDYFDDAESAASKYAFKCHRRVEGGKDVVYPVNAIGALNWGSACVCCW